MATAPQDRLIARLERGIASSPELEKELGISQAQASRLLRTFIAQDKVLRLGSTRGARYALHRPIAEIGSHWPVYRIDTEGIVQSCGTLHALAADQFCLQTRGEISQQYPALAYVGDGLPYFLQDQRPAGFLGRHVPALYPQLKLPPRVGDWSDAHYLAYLTQRGSDTISDLIVGEAALDHYLAGLRSLTAIEERSRESQYPILAEQALSGGFPGSSAHGEHPKFTALLGTRERHPHVLVKFSPPLDTSNGRRWSDLLVAEHLAHEILNARGVASCQSKILTFGNRAFLEIARFDRIGERGRIGVCSLHAIDASLYGKLDDWISATERLHADGHVTAQDLERVRLLSAFGMLIANTDRHLGNLAFFDRYDGSLALAPVYDMLPMLFAPQHDQMVARSFDAPRPTARILAAWNEAKELASTYWQALVADERISKEFRAIAKGSLQAVESA